MSKQDRQLDFENDFREEDEEEKVVKSTVTVDEDKIKLKATEIEFDPTKIDSVGQVVENAIGDKTLSRDEVIAIQYKAGYPLKQIVKEHGIAYGTVYHVLARKGVPLRSNVNNSKSSRRLQAMSQLDKQSLALDYKQGMTNADLYRKYDINKHGCYILLDEMGVSRRRDVADHSENIGAKDTPSDDEVESAIADIIENTVKKVKENKEPLLEKVENPALGLEIQEETILTEVEQVGDTLNITIMKDKKNIIKNVNVSFVD